MKSEEKDVVANALTDCTPLDRYESLDSWWDEFKKRFAQRKKEMKKQQKEVEKLENELGDNNGQP